MHDQSYNFTTSALNSKINGIKRLYNRYLKVLSIQREHMRNAPCNLHNLKGDDLINSAYYQRSQHISRVVDRAKTLYMESIAIK